VVIAFIDRHRLWWGVEPICGVLAEHGVRIAPSTFYAARKRAPSRRARRDEVVAGEIRRVFHDPAVGRGLYGARKVYEQLRRDARAGVLPPGVGPVARCTVERLMRAEGLVGVRRGRAPVTTRSDPGAERPDDLVRRRFRADRPNELWVVDFTYVSTWQAMAYTAFVSDVHSRRIVGWRVADRMPTELPLDALEMALFLRARNGEGVEGVIHHSDAGSQYTSIRYTLRLADAGAVASIGTVGDSYDNALAESVVGLYKTECVRPARPLRTVAQLELATADWVQWFNTARLHSSIGYNTPIEIETAYYRNNPRPQPGSG
jgi:putative transposase